jgi:nucleotide-binding universal stress UspA family protein
LQSLLLGSTSTALVHHATRPILVVPLPPEAVQEQDKKD